MSCMHIARAEEEAAELRITYAFLMCLYIASTVVCTVLVVCARTQVSATCEAVLSWVLVYMGVLHLR
jgi:hypothetical protein